MRSSCGWETISHSQGCAGGLSPEDCSCLQETVSLGGQSCFVCQIFLDVSLGFNSDDAFSLTALSFKSKDDLWSLFALHTAWQYVYLSEMTEMHTWVLITPLPERAWFLLAASSSFSLFLQHSHKSPGEHLHSKQHEMNVDLAKQHWKLVIYMSCTSRNNLLNEDAACLTPKVEPDLFNWYPGSFCSVAKDSFLCRAAEFSCVCAAFWTSIFFSCGYRKPERQSGSLLKHKLSFSPTADYVHVLSDPSDAIDLKTKYFIFYFK